MVLFACVTDFSALVYFTDLSFSVHLETSNIKQITETELNITELA